MSKGLSKEQIRAIHAMCDKKARIARETLKNTKRLDENLEDWFR